VRRITKIAALAAIPAVAVVTLAASASASVSYDATHDGVITGYVGKGAVQPVLNWNEADVQNKPVEFSTTFSSIKDSSWTCNNGDVRHDVYTVNFKQVLTSETVRKSNGKIDGWNLTGLGGLTLTGTTGNRFPSYDCADAGGLATIGVAQDHAFGHALYVNGVLLPETPVAV
jgi:hypothetical protein